MASHISQVGLISGGADGVSARRRVSVDAQIFRTPTPGGIMTAAPQVTTADVTAKISAKSAVSVVAAAVMWLVARRLGLSGI
jgi:hypothetical protein